jgi:hypothetical protein
MCLCVCVCVCACVHVCVRARPRIDKSKYIQLQQASYEEICEMAWHSVNAVPTEATTVRKAREKRIDTWYLVKVEEQSFVHGRELELEYR